MASILLNHIAAIRIPYWRHMDHVLNIILSGNSQLYNKTITPNSHSLLYVHHSTLWSIFHYLSIMFIWVTYGVNMTEVIWPIARWKPSEYHMNFMWFSSGSAPYRFCHIDAICNPYEYDGYIKSILASYGNATGDVAYGCGSKSCAYFRFCGWCHVCT